MAAKAVELSEREKIDIEKRNRIRLSIAAYAYEFKDHAIMADAAFDALAMEINPQMETGDERMDEFFKDEFSSSTTLWIHWHPNIEKIESIYAKVYGHRSNDGLWERAITRPVPKPMEHTRHWMED